MRKERVEKVDQNDMKRALENNEVMRSEKMVEGGRDRRTQMEINGNKKTETKKD